MPQDKADDSNVDIYEEFIEADELDALRTERDELRDKFMRALADAENARKRGERDRREEQREPVRRSHRARHRKAR